MARIIDLDLCTEIKQHCDHCGARCGYSKSDITKERTEFYVNCPHCGGKNRVFPPNLWVKDIKESK